MLKIDTKEYQGFYYSNGKRIPLEQSDKAFALKMRKEKSPLSKEAVSLLRDKVNPLLNIPHYGIKVYKTGALERTVSVLEKETAVEFATPAYKRSPKSEELMFVTKEFFVQFKPEVSREQIDRINSNYGVDISKVLDYAPNAYMLEIEPESEIKDAVALSNIYYENEPVVFSHPNFISLRHKRSRTAVAEYERVEIRTEESSEERSIFLPKQWHLKKANATDAWEITQGSKEINIAILDDGVDTSHPEFIGKVIKQFDYTTHEPNGEPKSENDNHGTACAGVALASGKKAFGGAPECSMIVVRTPEFLGSDDEAEMFKWTADEGADIISCSWGPPDGIGSEDPLPDNVRAAIRYCVNNGRNGKGIPIFWAAGNGNESVDLDGYASNPDVIAIAASTSEDTKAWYSDFGKAIWVSAPSSGNSSLGEKSIFTTDRSGEEGYNSGTPGLGDITGDYTNDFGGTSSAAPLAAGIGALILSIRPELTAQQVKEILARTADKIGENYLEDSFGYGQRNDIFGYGRINALKAVQMAKNFDVIDTPGNTEDTIPSILGPESILRTGNPPKFQVNPGVGRHYAIEFATRSELFDIINMLDRDDSNYYGSWKEGLYSSSTYILPQNVWNKLKGDGRLYYRLWTSTLPDSWEDEDFTSIKFINIKDSRNVTTERMVEYPSGISFEIVDSPEDGIDYSDPSENGIVPLIEVKGHFDKKLSENFKVHELAAKDRVQYARISPELVKALQKLRDELKKPIRVNSAYRYPAYNNKVKGAAKSQHMAGRAADITCHPMKPLDLAQKAIEVLGCNIGIGLYKNFVHVDVRGHFSAWAHENAVMTSSEFRKWVKDICNNVRSERYDSDVNAEEVYNSDIEENDIYDPGADFEEILELGSVNIEAPSVHRNRYESPVFTIKSDSDCYFAVEVTIDPKLFDQKSNGHLRNADNFFASWESEMRFCSNIGTTYTLPDYVWETFKTAQFIYYRILTTSSPEPEDGWVDFRTSLGDAQAESAPWIELLIGRNRTVSEEKASLLPEIVKIRDELLWRS